MSFKWTVYNSQKILFWESPHVLIIGSLSSWFGKIKENESANVPINGVSVHTIISSRMLKKNNLSNNLILSEDLKFPPNASLKRYITPQCNWSLDKILDQENESIDELTFAITGYKSFVNWVKSQHYLCTPTYVQ